MSKAQNDCYYCCNHILYQATARFILKKNQSHIPSRKEACGHTDPDIRIYEIISELKHCIMFMVSVSRKFLTVSWLRGLLGKLLSFKPLIQLQVVLQCCTGGGQLTECIWLAIKLHFRYNLSFNVTIVCVSVSVSWYIGSQLIEQLLHTVANDTFVLHRRHHSTL